VGPRALLDTVVVVVVLVVVVVVVVVVVIPLCRIFEKLIVTRNVKQ
jgi:hypothetical protein